MPVSHAHLRSFHAVASCGNFTRGAEQLNITQPTLSGQVKELEERYGVKLFIRHGRRVELTDFGKSVFDITRKLFHFESEAERLLLYAKGLSAGQLSVAADSPYIITPLLAKFQRRFPGIQVSIHYGNSQQVMKWLESGSCDIAIVPNIASDDTRLQTLLLSSHHLVLFVGGDHEWAKRRSASLDELLSQRVILREAGSHTRTIFEQALKENNIKLKKKMVISGREGVCEAVAAGFGVGVVLENELSDDSRVRVLQIDNATMQYSEYAVCRKSNSEVRATAAFFELAREEFSDATGDAG